MEDRVNAGVIVRSVSEKTGYTTSHVRNILRRFADRLGAELDGNRWSVLRSAEVHLVDLVLANSGKRRKLGERG